MSVEPSTFPGSPSRHLLDSARERPHLRNKVILLAAAADFAQSPDSESFPEFNRLASEVTLESGLTSESEDADLQGWIEWLLEAAPEAAYFLRTPMRSDHSPRYKVSVGYVFVSWTVKTPREREAVRGIKDALDWFNIDYFDYTEHQIGDETDRSDTIRQQLEEAVSSSQASVEVVSSRTSRAWIQFERELISKNNRIHRFWASLDKDDQRSMHQGGDDQITELDFSGSCNPNAEEEQFPEWAQESVATRQFATKAYFSLCYALAQQIHGRLTDSRRRGILGRLQSKYLRKTDGDVAAFVRSRHQVRLMEYWAMSLRTGHNCVSSRMDDLLFPTPRSWECQKRATGHWWVFPGEIRKGLAIQLMFFNVGHDAMDSAEALMAELEEKADERNWKLRNQRFREIDAGVTAMDAIAEAPNNVTHRFLNFCYNGLEYCIEIRTDWPELTQVTEIVWDAWFDRFSLRPT